MNKPVSILWVVEFMLIPQGIWIIDKTVPGHILAYETRKEAREDIKAQRKLLTNNEDWKFRVRKYQSVE